MYHMGRGILIRTSAGMVVLANSSALPSTGGRPTRRHDGFNMNRLMRKSSGISDAGWRNLSYCALLRASRQSRSRYHRGPRSCAGHQSPVRRFLAGHGSGTLFPLVALSAAADGIARLAPGNDSTAVPGRGGGRPRHRGHRSCKLVRDISIRAVIRFLSTGVAARAAPCNIR